MFLTLLFHRVITLNEFKEISPKFIADEAARKIFLQCVEEIYESELNSVSLSKTIDIFIPEVAF
jgi:hypothetical protein